MRSREHFPEARGETVLLVPFLAVLVGLLIYFFVVVLPKVKVLPG